MHDRPNAEELLASVGEFLVREVLPAVPDERLRFRVRVAANVLAIVGREVRLEEEGLVDEYERLLDIYPDEEQAVPPAATSEIGLEVQDLTLKLARDIREGRVEAVPGSPVWTHVRSTLVEKLRVANPAYLERRGEPVPGSGA